MNIRPLSIAGITINVTFLSMNESSRTKYLIEFLKDLMLNNYCRAPFHIALCCIDHSWIFSECRMTYIIMLLRTFLNKE